MDRHQYSQELLETVADEVWSRTFGNGSVRVVFDSDTIYSYPEGDEQIAEARSWVNYWVRSTINRLIDHGFITVPDSFEEH